MTPAELLVALHHVPVSRATIDALAVCIDVERAAFSQEVVAVALQRLLGEREVPVLLLRTVMVALKRHPALSRFVCTNVLPALIRHSLWRDKRRWEGFVKCCQVRKLYYLFVCVFFLCVFCF